ncbi:hypothetical protein DUHN55_38080 [Helicobacter pylori]
MPLLRPAPLVDIVDETFVRAAPDVVRARLEAPGLLDGLCPGVRREVVQDRGTKGVRWRIEGEVTGRMEVWLEAAHGGTIVHHFVHGEHGRGSARWARRYRCRWKGAVHEIKDRLEGRAR